VSLNDELLCDNWRTYRVLGRVCCCIAADAAWQRCQSQSNRASHKPLHGELENLEKRMCRKENTRMEAPKYKSHKRRVGASEERLRTKNVRSGTWQAAAASSSGQVQPRHVCSRLRERNTPCRAIRPKLLTGDTDRLRSRKWLSWTSLFKSKATFSTAHQRCAIHATFAKTPRSLGRKLARSNLAASH
jgi:hypothetical protein